VTFTHQPVLTEAVVRHLDLPRPGVIVDCTIGLGGHARALLEAGAERVLGLDRDREAITVARERLSEFPGDRVELVHADYRQLPSVLAERGIEQVDGVLADLGVSSMQLDDERGFSFRRDEPLDMRMDRTGEATAAELLAHVPERELADIIYQWGEERYSRRIARAIVERRRAKPFESTGDLAAVVRQAVPRRGYERIDPATRTFQAIRIWVNRELDGLDRFIEDAVRHLRAGARLVIITFHSLEDRIVKHTFRALASGTPRRVQILTRKPVTPDATELARNPRARSAKLRAAERLA
jgi:16S rRNA (cytosine1402-N4)-methyltransferase